MLSRSTVFGVAMLCCAATHATSVRAQCVGDCGNDGQVSLADLVTATRIALGEGASCAPADRDGDGVTIDDVVAAVNVAVGGCSLPATPTATPSPTATRTPEGPTPTAVAGCGDGSVDSGGGETCDDGNTIEGDSCPANCRIATCALDSSSSVDVDVSFNVPAGKEIVGVQTFLRYADGVIAIRGTGGDNNVFEQLSHQPDNVVLQPNDLEYGLILVAYSFDGSAILPGQLVTVHFNGCRGARLPTADDFRCQVAGAGASGGDEVDGVTCSAAARP